MPAQGEAQASPPAVAAMPADEQLDGQGDGYSDETENTVDPRLLWADKRPPTTFVQLIRAALLASDRQRLYLHEIYAWISANHPYYRPDGSGWKNCVRHALSSHGMFVRIKEAVMEGHRGSEWCLRETVVGQVHLEHGARIGDCREAGTAERSPRLSCLENAAETAPPPAAIASSVLLGIAPNPNLCIRPVEDASAAPTMQTRREKKKRQR